MIFNILQDRTHNITKMCVHKYSLKYYNTMPENTQEGKLFIVTSKLVNNIYTAKQIVYTISKAINTNFKKFGKSISSDPTEDLLGSNLLKKFVSYI